MRVASIAFATAVVASASCSPEPQNSKKNNLSKVASDPDALFADESITDVAADGAAGAPPTKQLGAVTKKKSPTWTVPGAPQTAPQAPPPVEAEPSEHSARKGPAPQPDTDQPSSNAGRWSIVLLSFTGEDHSQLAHAACVNIRGRYPSLAKAFTRERSSGSVVVVGHFSGPGDRAVKPLLDQVHAMVDGATRPFARAMLTRLETSKESAMGAFDLRRARQANPTARSLYSVEVAVWSDFGSNEISLETIRTNAESHAKRLRTQGLIAFFHHDDDRRMSIVTIGLFGPDAYNAQTMLYSSEVEAIKKKFPKLLVNGEELRRPIRTGSQETVADTSFLIEVPR